MGTRLTKTGTFFSIRTRIGVQFSPKIREVIEEDTEAEWEWEEELQDIEDDEDDEEEDNEDEED